MATTEALPTGCAPREAAARGPRSARRAARAGAALACLLAAVLAAGCASVGERGKPAAAITAHTPLQTVDWRAVENTAGNPVGSAARSQLDADHLPAPDEGALARHCFLHDADYTTRTLRMSATDREAVAAAYAQARSLAQERVALANERHRLEQLSIFLDDAAIARASKADPRRRPGPLHGMDHFIVALWPEHGQAQRQLAHNRAVLEARDREFNLALGGFEAALAAAHGRMLAAWAQAPAGTYPLEIVGELEAYRQSHLHDCRRVVAGGGRLALPDTAGSDADLAAFVRGQVAQQRTALAARIARAADRGEFDHLLDRLNRTPQLRLALAADADIQAAARAARQRFEVAEAAQRERAAQAQAAEDRRQARLQREAALARVRENPAPTSSQMQEYLAQLHHDEYQRRGEPGLQRAGHGAYSKSQSVPFVGTVTVVFRFEVEGLRCTRLAKGHRCSLAYQVGTRSNLPSPLAALGLNAVDRENLSADFRWTEAGLVSPQAEAFVARRAERLIGAHNARVERSREREQCISSHFHQRGGERYSSARQRAEAACP